MSPRRNHPKRRARGGENSNEDRPLGMGMSVDSREEHPDGDYIVRKISGSTSTKPYRCPGCDQMIPTATPHTVAWLEHDVEGRRHWHNACWAKKNNRAPRTERTRNAPRY